MLFVSPIFLFVFFPIVFICHTVIQDKYKNGFLALASFIFYAWGGLAYALLILLSTIVNYVLGLLVARDKRKKLYLVLALTYNIGILGFFKYFNFIVDNIVALMQISNPEYAINAPLIPLPIGISFFTFQIMSYVIDIYWGNVKEQKSFINLALYIMLFPQLIAGPIVRYIDVEKEIYNREITVDKINQGIRRFIIGFSKKLLIANAMGQIADYFFNNPDNQSTIGVWMGIIAYALQIYYDFSAYSDMAIGIGKMFGFNFLENFNYPYISTSIQEFWRRWHMSLSSWFRDYLYIPLGGNRKGNVRTYINLMIVFFITGLWHGSSWNFVIWGLFHGCFLIIERLGFKKIIDRLPKAISWLYTMVVVLLGWVFFRAVTFVDAISYIKKMFTFDMDRWARILLIVDNEALVMLFFAIILCYPLGKKINELINKKPILENIYNLWITLIFFISVLYMTGSSFNPFIYFIF